MSKALTAKDIQNLYTSPEVPGALTAIPTFFKSLRGYYQDDPGALKGWTQARVVEAVKNLPAYSLFKQPHRPRRKNRYAQVMTRGPGSQWQADLIEFPVSFARGNKGFHFLLVCIDVFTKRAFTQALKTKHGKGVAEAFQLLFKEAVPRKVQTDSGKEFYNHFVSELFNKHHIKLFTTQNTEKAQIVERLNRTLKERLERIRQLNRDDNWIDHYKAVTSSYNNTANSAHGLTPNRVGPKNAHLVRDKLYYGLGRYPLRREDEGPGGGGAGKLKVKKTRPIPVGAYVRLHKKKKQFEKASTRIWTTQVFRVAEIIPGTVPLRYRVEYLDGEKIDGSFYQRELQEVDLPKEWAVHKTRTHPKTKKVLVTFASIPDKEEWVSPGQLRQDKSNKKWWYVPAGVGRWKGRYQDQDQI